MSPRIAHRESCGSIPCSNEAFLGFVIALLAWRRIHSVVWPGAEPDPESSTNDLGNSQPQIGGGLSVSLSLRAPETSDDWRNIPYTHLPNAEKRSVITTVRVFSN
jgi:hypothetical protein